MRSRLTNITLPLAIMGIHSPLIAEEMDENTLPVMKVLPVGSSLHDLRIPQFNKDYERTSVLFAKQMDILENKKIKGTKVDITIYKNNQAQATTHLETAYYQETTGIIHSMDNLTISGDSFDIAAQGLILHWEKRTGFLLGKTQTLFYSDKDKKMTSPVSKPQKKKSLPLVNTKLSPKTLAAAAVTIPAILTAEEIKEIDTLAQSSAPLIEKVDQQAQKDIQMMERVSKSIDTQKELLHSQLVLASGQTTTSTTPAVPVEPKADKIPVSVNCEKGMYFDAISGTIVYQKDIVVTHPQYNLTCDDELKVILKEKPNEPKAKPNKTESEESSSTSEKKETASKSDKSDKSVIPDSEKATRFSGISKAIATGNVVIESKNKDGKLIITHSQTASYDGETGIIILKGGNPTVQQGDTIARVLSDSGYIKILPNMSVRIEGRHEIKANLNELQNK